MARTQASEAVARPVRRRRAALRMRLDPATAVGLIGAFALVTLAMALGTGTAAFFNLPGLLIVLGGTFGVTAMCFSLREVAHAPQIVAQAVFDAAADPADTVRRMLALAEQARWNGPLALENALASLNDMPFARRAFAMVVDGSPAEEIEALLARDTEQMIARHLDGAAILRKAAEVAPAMGLIGTLIGLVQMLGNLDDPSNIGPSMAVALLTTFYGAILSTMLFAPLAAKLDRNSRAETLVRNVTVLAAASVARRENPRRLESVLNALLPPAGRITHFK